MENTTNTTETGNQVDYTEHNGLIGNPITAMLMGQANAGDMSTGDHTDGAGVSLAEALQRRFGQLGHDTDHADEVTGHASPGHATEGDELADHLLEIENLVEGARDAVVRRLEQFDSMDERNARIEAKLDRVLEGLSIVMEAQALAARQAQVGA